jgi:hypothetical protein
MAGVLQLQNAQQTNQLNDFGLQERQRSMESANALRSLFAQPGFDPNSEDGYRAVSRIDPMQAAAMRKDRQAQLKSQSDIDKNNFETASKRFGAYKQTIGSLSKAPNLTRDMVVRAGQQMVQMGVMPQSMFDDGIADLPEDPVQLRAALEDDLRTQLTPEQMFSVFSPKVATVDNGQQIFRVDDNPNSRTFGQRIGAPAVQKMQSPESVASTTTSRENAAATRDVAQATRDAATIQTGFQNESGLRKEFEALPEIKNYKQAYPAFAAIKDAAGRNTPQADINIVYGIAKLYDPTSVVREGEYATVANSPNIPEKIKGYAQYLAGGGRLSPETKAQILAEAQGRLGTYEAEAGKARSSYDAIARRRGIDPANVFQGMGDMGNAPGLPDMSAVDAEIERRKKGGK